MNHNPRIYKAPKVLQTAAVPDISGQVPGLVLLAILDFENVDPPPGYPMDVGYAAGISYTVAAQTPNGLVSEQAGVIPSVPRAPQPYLIRAFPIPQSSDQEARFIYPGAVCNGVIYLTIAEDWYSEECT